MKALQGRLAQLRQDRDSQWVCRALDDVRQVAAQKENLMPYILEAVKCDAMLGEVSTALRDVLGTYQGSRPEVLVKRPPLFPIERRFPLFTKAGESAPWRK